MDFEHIDGFTVRLRAERAGNGNGRIYTLVYQAQGACGNLRLPVTATVTVPASQGNGGGKPREGGDGAGSSGTIFLPWVNRQGHPNSRDNAPSPLRWRGVVFNAQGRIRR